MYVCMYVCMYVIDHKIGRTPLHAACSGGYHDCVELLLSHGADVNIHDDVSNIISNSLPYNLYIIIMQTFKYLCFQSTNRKDGQHFI